MPIRRDRGTLRRRSALCTESAPDLTVGFLVGRPLQRGMRDALERLAAFLNSRACGLGCLGE